MADKETMYELELNKAVTYDGKEIKKLTFDFDKLTGQDSLDILEELRRMRRQAMVPALDAEYLIRMLAKACTENIGCDFFSQMGIVDHNNAVALARNFLLK